MGFIGKLKKKTKQNRTKNKCVTNPFKCRKKSKKITRTRICVSYSHCHTIFPVKSLICVCSNCQKFVSWHLKIREVEMAVVIGLAGSLMGLQILLAFSFHSQQRICQCLLAQEEGRGSLDLDIFGAFSAESFIPCLQVVHRLSWSREWCGSCP